MSILYNTMLKEYWFRVLPARSKPATNRNVFILEITFIS